jgi:hypothetical protein
MKREWKQYGGDTFKWEIVATCRPGELLSLEQHYLDILQPAYNTAKRAFSPVTRMNRVRSAPKKKTVLYNNKTKRLITYISQKFENALEKILQTESDEQ